jgi:phosphoribosyl-ATP pyrophosphohydrolase
MRPLDQLEATIRQRQQAGEADKSYTAKLLAGGVAKIGPKVTEEAAEVVEAAAPSRDAADVVYHLMVLMAARGVELAEVERELARRFGMSGLDEKASRGPINQ